MGCNSSKLSDPPTEWLDTSSSITAASSSTYGRRPSGNTNNEILGGLSARVNLSGNKYYEDAKTKVNDINSAGELRDFMEKEYMNLENPKHKVTVLNMLISKLDDIPPSGASKKNLGSAWLDIYKTLAWGQEKTGINEKELLTLKLALLEKIPNMPFGSMNYFFERSIEVVKKNPEKWGELVRAGVGVINKQPSSIMYDAAIGFALNNIDSQSRLNALGQMLPMVEASINVLTSSFSEKVDILKFIRDIKDSILKNGGSEQASNADKENIRRILESIGRLEQHVKPESSNRQSRVRFQ